MVIIVPADGPAPYSARPSAGTELCKVTLSHDISQHFGM